MTRFTIFSLAVVFGAACASGPTGPKPAPAPKRPAPAAKAETVPAVRAANDMAGRIVSVNPKLRFVVVDFANHRLPALEERLAVYRAGQKVAEIKISGPYRLSTVAADITSGEAKYGDEIRPE